MEAGTLNVPLTHGLVIRFFLVYTGSILACWVTRFSITENTGGEACTLTVLIYLYIVSPDTFSRRDSDSGVLLGLFISSRTKVVQSSIYLNSALHGIPLCTIHTL